MSQGERIVTDVLVVGSGTGLAAALAARERGWSVLVIEKTALVGGSTARSGGAFWIPNNPVVAAEGGTDSSQRAEAYLESVVAGSSPSTKLKAYVKQGGATVQMLQRMTRLSFVWARGYSDYHPEEPGGSAVGRSVESRPFNVRRLGSRRDQLRPSVLETPIPMPVTGADYKWLNLMTRVPARGLTVAVKRAIQGLGGLALGREYAAGGQALAAGLYDGAIRAGIPVWTKTSLVHLERTGERVTGAVLQRDGKSVNVDVRRGVILAAGGFDHDMEWRHHWQSPALKQWSLGAEGNTGDAIKIAQSIGARTVLMDQAWWFPAVAPVPGGSPAVLLAERSLPGSFIIDRHGRRFVNEAQDYMSFGQCALAREKAGDPVGDMWLVFDQRYRNSYLLGGSVFPGAPLPKSWYDNRIAVKAGSPRDLASRMGVPTGSFAETFARFNTLASVGVDEDHHRGDSAYDRYYGDPTVTPNPNLRPLNGAKLLAVKVVLSDLGTCGGLETDEHTRVIGQDGDPIGGLYAIGNTAGNLFGRSYPGAGATIGQGLVGGFVAAQHLTDQQSLSAG